MNWSFNLNLPEKKEGLLIAGSPARILRRGVIWDERPYGVLLAQMRGETVGSEGGGQ